jgi:hypothetical protein
LLSYFEFLTYDCDFGEMTTVVEENRSLTPGLLLGTIIPPLDDEPAVAVEFKLLEDESLGTRLESALFYYYTGCIVKPEKLSEL